MECTAIMKTNTKKVPYLLFVSVLFEEKGPPDDIMFMPLEYQLNEVVDEFLIGKKAQQEVTHYYLIKDVNDGYCLKCSSKYTNPEEIKRFCFNEDRKICVHWLCHKCKENSFKDVFNDTKIFHTKFQESILTETCFVVEKSRESSDNRNIEFENQLINVIKSFLLDKNAMYISTRYELLNGDNFGKCFECGSWCSNPEEPDYIHGLSIGKIIDGRWLCDICMPEDDPLHF